MSDTHQVEGRNYFFGFGSQITRAIRFLLITNIAIFFVQLLLWDDQRITQMFGMMPALFIHDLKLWQPLTTLFLHANLWQLLMDLLVLWFFAPDVEIALGGGIRFLSFYLFCGTSSNVIAAAIAPNAMFPVLGPAGAIFGILTAFAVLFPQRIITLLLFFVIPVQLKAKYLVMIFGLIAWLSLAEGKFMNVASYAGLSGIAIGYLYVRNRRGLEKFWNSKFFNRFRHSAVFGNKQEKEEYIRRKIDPILEKIARHGLHSLTWREKRILRKAKTKIKS